VLYFAYFALNNLGYVYEWTNGRLGTERPPQVQKTSAAPAAPAAVPAEAPKPAKP
jgi:hypothetical protein